MKLKQPHASTQAVTVACKRLLPQKRKEKNPYLKYQVWLQLHSVPERVRRQSLLRGTSSACQIAKAAKLRSWGRTLSRGGGYIEQSDYWSQATGVWEDSYIHTAQPCVFKTEKLNRHGLDRRLRNVFLDNSKFPTSTKKVFNFSRTKKKKQKTLHFHMFLCVFDIQFLNLMPDKN